MVSAGHDSWVELLEFFGQLYAERQLVLFHVVRDGSWSDDHATGIMAYGGIVAPQEPWLRFHGAWQQLLVQHNLSALYMSQAMRFSGEFARLARGWGDEREARRDTVLSSFIDTCTGTDFRPIGSAADVRLFSEKKRNLRKAELFQGVVKLALESIPSPHEVLLVCDEEQDADKDFLRWLKNFKLRHDAARRRIRGICFMDDKLALPLQAADMLVYLIREECDRRRRRSIAAPNPLYRRFATTGPVEERTQYVLEGHFLTDDGVEAL